ncbi:sulfurtransferase complex subunit TusB [Paraferrimonas sp. SM1919]|uniref:sulfurtransferase complex subunit TusB n=1 Tax=Paraferrimonas sp. SM1919 TaxID=2662263 RepID=UPI0013D60DDA|nr:sulfurtransferase complex subunit TusB [Paraferrimonas sp. SM1919]
MILHKFSVTPSDNNALNACAKLLGPDDTLVLSETGVLLACQPQLLAQFKQTKVVAMAQDIVSRSLQTKVCEQVQLIDLEQLVQLTLSHEKVISWSH